MHLSANQSSFGAREIHGAHLSLIELCAGVPDMIGIGTTPELGKRRKRR
jgi:hypothetical protein